MRAALGKMAASAASERMSFVTIDFSPKSCYNTGVSLFLPSDGVAAPPGAFPFFSVS